jgi:hypothetical protein
VVAGTVDIAGVGPAAGIAVVMEPMVEGLPLSAARRLAALGSAALPGALRAGASAASTDARATVTDAAGRFEFADVPEGDYLVCGTARDHRAGSVPVRVARAAAAETTLVDIALVPVGTVTGVVLLEGQAAGAHHSTIVSIDGASSVAVTGPGGGFRLDDVPAGAGTVRASHWGYLSKTVPVVIASAGDSVDVGTTTLSRDANLPPVAVATATASGNTLQPFALGGGGTDDDGAVVLHEWDFENDGVFDWSSPAGAATTHLYATPGAKRAKLRVTDDKGAVGYDVVAFHVHDAYHVALTGDDANDGRSNAPFRTLTFALAASQANGNIPVRVALGTYVEAVAFVDLVDLTGGYDPVTWSRTAGSRSIIDAGTSSSQAVSLTSADFVGLDLRAQDAAAPSGNSIALRILDCGPGVTFTDCALRSGKGANGANGSQGTNGAAGAGFSGGSGGGGGTSSQIGGRTGSSGAGPSGGAGGTGGATACADGADGAAGGPGSTGAHGVQAQVGGSATTTAWLPFGGNAGQNGTHGSGGGGGGGEGYCFPTVGDAGGRGGDGGAGGQGGAGGGGGGASFALFSTVTGPAGPSFIGCEFTAGAAGDGGTGGNAGAGGAGTSGQSSLSSGGGTGGAGGAGGAAGAGSGGAGGLSHAVLARGTAPAFSGCTFTPGAAGAGGAGGYRGLPLFSAPSGPAGLSGTVLLSP